MKKILAILISVLLLMNMTVVVFAQDDITINVDFDKERKAFTISGHINYTRDRIPVALFMTQGETIVAVAEVVATGREEAGIPYTFSDIVLKNSTRTGDIAIKVTTAELDYVSETSYPYSGIDRQCTALNTLKSAIESGDYDTLKAAILSTKDELGIDENLVLVASTDFSPIILAIVPISPTFLPAFSKIVFII